MDGGPAAPAKLRAAERRQMALALRLQGGSYRQIAEQLRKNPAVPDTYSVSTAYEDVMAELRRLNTRNAELADETRRLELERLDQLHARYWGKALAGDLICLDRVLNIMNRRAQYLGLYAPVKTASELSGPEGAALIPNDLAKVIERIYGAGNSGPTTDLPGDDGGGAG